MARSLATGILSSIPIEKDLENELIPKPQGQDQLLEKKRILIQKNIIGPKQGLSANQIHSEYRKFIEQRAQTELAPIQNVFAGALGISRQDFKNPSKLSRTIATRLLDPFYSSGLARYKFAVFGLYEQEWKHVGYSRGDLIKSLSLCPGETVTLEYHYWDKSTVKSEQELSSELELKSSSTLTQRDSKELLDELTKNN